MDTTPGTKVTTTYFWYHPQKWFYVRNGEAHSDEMKKACSEQEEERHSSDGSNGSHSSLKPDAKNSQPDSHSEEGTNNVTASVEEEGDEEYYISPFYPYSTLDPRGKFPSFPRLLHQNKSDPRLLSHEEKRTYLECRRAQRERAIMAQINNEQKETFSDGSQVLFRSPPRMEENSNGEDDNVSQILDDVFGVWADINWTGSGKPLVEIMDQETSKSGRSPAPQSRPPQNSHVRGDREQREQLNSKHHAVVKRGRPDLVNGCNKQPRLCQERKG